MIDVLFAGFLRGGDAVVVPCTVEIENTAESLHAHVDLDGVQVGPGDMVTVLDAPTGLAFGEKRTFRCRAAVVRAGLVERTVARVAGRFGINELYEVSFSDGRVK